MVIFSVLNNTPIKVIIVEGGDALHLASSMSHFSTTDCNVLKANYAFCGVSTEAKSFK